MSQGAPGGRPGGEGLDDKMIAIALEEGRFEEAAAALSARYRQRLTAYAARVLGDAGEAEDVCQEVILRARGARGLSGEGARLAGWLYAVCYRLSVDRLRARKRRMRLFRTSRSPGGPSDPAGDVQRREAARLAEEALCGLDEPYRTAIVLRYLEGLDFPEIARRMGSIERTARTWVGRGLSALRARMRTGEDA